MSCVFAISLITLAFQAIAGAAAAAQRQMKPFESQLVGYQFYARIALPTGLSEELRAAYTTMVKHEKSDSERQLNEKASMLNLLSGRFELVADGSRFDALREEGYRHCAGLQNSLHSEVDGGDRCTHVRFSPFRLCCDLEIVVTADCFAKRQNKSGERFDSALAALLTSHRVAEARIDSDSSVPRPRRESHESILGVMPRVVEI